MLQKRPEVRKQPEMAQSQEMLFERDSQPAVGLTAPVVTVNPDEPVAQSPYRLEVLTRVGENQPHNIDVVTIHDYDETSVNWAYNDEDAILQQRINNVRAEKSRLAENPEKPAVPNSRGECGRRISAVKTSRLAPATLAPPETALTRVPSLQDVSKDRESVRRGGMASLALQVPETHDAISSRNTEVGSSRASSPGSASRPNWLQDTNMLPRALPGVRVLEFSYPAYELSELLHDNSEERKRPDFVEKAALELLSELKKFRPYSSYCSVPIVFLGAGFGGVIMQKAINLAVHKPGPDEQVPKSRNTGERAEPGSPESKRAEGGAASQTPQLQLDQVADIIFMDTPFPKEEGEGLTDFFPLNAAGVRISDILKVAKKMETKWDAPGIDKIWGQFWAALRQERQATRVSWFYSSTANTTTGRMLLPSKKASQTTDDRTLPVITLSLVPLQRSDFRRLTNFRDAKDCGYKATVSRIQESLMIKAVRDERFKELQLSLIKAGASVNVENDWGLSLLHLAAAAPNLDGVKMLLENHANPQARGPNRQTPLLYAINIFCDSKGDWNADKIRHLQDVIEKLLSFTTKPELKNNTDSQGRTARALLDSRGHRCSGPGCGHEVIQELLNKHRLVIRKRVGNEKEDAWKSWAPPEGGSVQQKACEGAKGIIAEFYDTNTGGASSDYEVPSVLDLIYQKEAGPAKIISRWAETKVSQQGSQDVHCGWIHIPANNEQWVHDLFVRLGLKDSSMDGQRHKGYTVFNQYMTADTKRYKQVRFPPLIAVQKPRLSIIAEDPILEGQQLDRAGFIETVNADDRGWMGLPLPKGLEGASDVIVLFMPVLAFEEHESRKKITRAIHRTLESLRTPGESALGRSSTMDSSGTGAKDRGTTIDMFIIEAYLQRERPVHCRRTLNQYRYCILETTETRDRDQVVYKWARSRQHQSQVSAANSHAEERFLGVKNRPLIIVDQLWLWILPDGTVISSLPNTADADEAYNLVNKLESAVFGDVEPSVRSVDDLVTVILKNCVDFFKRDGPCGVKFHDCFYYSISGIAEAEAKAYADYKEAVTCLEELKKRRLPRILGQRYTKTFSQITEETNLLADIIGIQGELSIVESVLQVQKNVLDKLIQKTHNKAKTPKRDAPVHAKGVTLRDSSRIKDVIQIVEDNILSVREMDTSAKKIQEDLKQLLDFKQQQLSAWEMQYSIILGLKDQAKNNVMLVFAFVTIVFLPLSFMSSFFALNVEGFPKDSKSGNNAWPLKELCGYLFGISLVLSIPLLVAAFCIKDIAYIGRRSRVEGAFNGAKATGDSPVDHGSDNSDLDMDAEQEKDKRKSDGTVRNRGSLLKEKVYLERERNVRESRRMGVDKQSENGSPEPMKSPLRAGGIWASPNVAATGGELLEHTGKRRPGFGIRDALGGRRRSRQELGDEV